MLNIILAIVLMIVAIWGIVKLQRESKMEMTQDKNSLDINIRLERLR